MSGGTFDYKEYNIESIANEIREIYLKHKCKEWIKWMRSKEFYTDFKPYPKKILAIYRKAYKTLKMAHIYAKRIDYLEAGDDGEESFLERTKQELNALEIEMKTALKETPEDIEIRNEKMKEEDRWNGNIYNF